MYKNVHILVVAFSILIFVLATESSAQRGIKWKGSGGWGMGAQYGRMYNPGTVEIIVGEIVAVEQITPIRGMSYGVHLIVKADSEDVSVHLGPGWYIENQDIHIKPKDKIEVKGSRITFEDKSVIIASEIKKDDEILLLRDENGFPVWSGWRRR